MNVPLNRDPHVTSLKRAIDRMLVRVDTDGEHIDAGADVFDHESVDTTPKHCAFASEQRRRARIHALKV